jgi:hypothetical protein
MFSVPSAHNNAREHDIFPGWPSYSTQLILSKVTGLLIAKEVRTSIHKIRKAAVVKSGHGEISALVQRRQAETSHLFEDNIRLSATVVRLIGVMALDNFTVVEN